MTMETGLTVIGKLTTTGQGDAIVEKGSLNLWGYPTKIRRSY
jgi:hypothetical protein